MASDTPFVASDHEWMDVQSGAVVSIQARPSPTEGVEAAPSDDAHETVETMCEAAYSEGLEEGERKGAEEARGAYAEGYYNGRASVEETNACMQAHCNARIAEVERACKARTMRLEAEKENAERELAKLRMLETAKEMVDAIAKTRQRFVDQVVATSEENHRLHKEAEAEASELRAQMRAKMAEACELRDSAVRKVHEHDKERRQLEQERDAFRDKFQALHQEGERRSGERAVQHAKLQAEIDRLKMALYKQDEYVAAQGLERQLEEQQRKFYSDEAERTTLKDTRPAVQIKVRDMTLYKQDEYVAAQGMENELQTARDTLEARENMLAQVKEELATERLTSAELERQRDEALERIANVNETATRQRVRAEKVEKERDAIKEEAEGRSRERTVQHTKLREEIEALQAQLKEKTEQWERQKATIAIYRKGQADQTNEHAKQRCQLESERNSLKATAEVAVRDYEAVASTLEDRDTEIAVLRKKVAEVEGEARALSIERDAAVTQREGTRTALELANEHCIRFEKEIAALKEDQERLKDAECKLKASGEQFDRLRTDYYAEKAKVAQLCEQLRVAVRDHEATKSHHKSLMADTSDAVDELGKVRRELAETKKALADMKGYKQDEYVAAQELQGQLEDQEWKCHSYVAERDDARRDLSTAKAELARCQELANVNHEKWQWAKEDGQRVSQLARAYFTKLQAVEVENESLRRMLSEEGGEKHRLQLEREREEYDAAMKLPMGNVRNAAVAKCFNSGVLPGASPEEVLASERMTASIVAAKAALVAKDHHEVHVLETNKGPNGLAW